MPAHKTQQESIKSSNCCGRCLYNIPQGTLVLLLPGVCLLIMGAIMFAIEGEDSWREGIVSTGMVMLILGALLTFAGCTMCVWSVVRCSRRKDHHQQPGPHYPSRPPVSTVGRPGLYGYDGPAAQTPSFSQQSPAQSTGDSDVKLVGVYRVTSEVTQPSFNTQHNVQNNTLYNPQTGQYVMDTSR